MDNAAKILEAAECAAASGLTTSEWTILIGARGGISLVADSDWSLDSLQLDRGAEMAYRVSRQADRVRLEGRAGDQRCQIETVQHGKAARRLLEGLLGGVPQYVLVGPASSRLLTAAGVAADIRATL
jgi:hypothetical protein